jgi:hypothetical protein
MDSLSSAFSSTTVKETEQSRPDSFSVVQWKWPLTHSERITELEDYIRDDTHQIHTANVHAAINYHKTFPPNDICSTAEVKFQKGLLVEKLDLSGPAWFEVSNIYLSLLFL